MSNSFLELCTGRKMTVRMRYENELKLPQFGTVRSIQEDRYSSKGSRMELEQRLSIYISLLISRLAYCMHCITRAQVMKAVI